MEIYNLIHNFLFSISRNTAMLVFHVTKMYLKAIKQLEIARNKKQHHLEKNRKTKKM